VAGQPVPSALTPGCLSAETGLWYGTVSGREPLDAGCGLRLVGRFGTQRRDCPDIGGIMMNAIRLVGYITGWGFADGMGGAVG